MDEVVAHLFQQLFIGAEEFRLLPFLEQSQVLLRPLCQHEGPARRDFDTARRLQITVLLSQETEVDVERTDCSSVRMAPQWPSFHLQATRAPALPRTPDPHRNT